MCVGKARVGKACVRTALAGNGVHGNGGRPGRGADRYGTARAPRPSGKQQGQDAGTPGAAPRSLSMSVISSISEVWATTIDWASRFSASFFAMST